MAMPATWIDHEGRRWKVPNAGQKLKFTLIPCHRALRAFVYTRDNFTCQTCGAFVPDPPTDYDGAGALSTNRISRSKFARRYAASPCYVMLVVDHVISRRNGGSNHPRNLQTLCDHCNCAKASLVDAKVARGLAA